MFQRPRGPFLHASSASFLSCRSTTSPYHFHVRPDLVCLSPSPHLSDQFLESPHLSFFCFLTFPTFKLLLPAALCCLLLTDPLFPLNSRRCNQPGDDVV